MERLTIDLPSSGSIGVIGGEVFNLEAVNGWGLSDWDGGGGGGGGVGGGGGGGGLMDRSISFTGTGSIGR